MIKFAAIALASMALYSCNGATGSGALNTPHATLERAEDDAETAYQGTVAALSAAQVAGRITADQAATDKLMAWNTLQKVRTAYNAGQDITALVTSLQSDKTHAQSQ